MVPEIRWCEIQECGIKSTDSFSFFFGKERVTPSDVQDLLLEALCPQETCLEVLSGVIWDVVDQTQVSLAGALSAVL